MNTEQILVWGLRAAGVGQIFIAAIYFWLRGIISWNADLAKLRPHNRAIANTYSRYIQVLNTAFGLICLFQPRDLLAKTPLAVDLTLIIGLYWGVRLVLSLVYYDNREITRQRALFRFGEYAFNALFLFQATALFAAFAYDLG